MSLKEKHRASYALCDWLVMWRVVLQRYILTFKLWGGKQSLSWWRALCYTTWSVLVLMSVRTQAPVIFFWSSKLSIKDIVFPRHQAKHTNTQVLLLTQMRSGSSLTGHLLIATPSTFYTEEPIREYLGDEPLSSEKIVTAVSLLRDIFLCRFSARPDYYQRRLMGMHHHNTDTVRLCYESNDLCWDPTTNEAFCHAARVRLTRVVAMELGAVAPLLEDPDMNTHVIHLVRDPRGTLSSREALKIFFSEGKRNITSLCSRYRSDLHAASIFKKNFPDRYTFLRYEDLSLDPWREVPRLYNRVNLPYTALAASVVAHHTLGYTPDDNSYGTTRNSTATVFSWRARLPFSTVVQVQRECGDVLVAYGYNSFTSQQEYDDPKVGILQPCNF